MPKRSKVTLLPPAVREQLEQILIERGFSGYAELEQWCKGQGIKVSKSALHRFGQAFESRVAGLKVATEQARAIVSAEPDNDNAMNDALIRLVQEQMFTLLRDLSVEERAKLDLGKIARGIAQVGRASVQQKKYATEVQKRAQEAAAAVASVAKKGGLSASAVDKIKREILGIAA